MFPEPRILSIAALLAAVMMAPPTPAAAAEPTQVIKIKVKQVIFYESADGKPAGRIPRDKLSVPIEIKDTSANGRLLVTIDGKDRWIPKALTVTDEGPPEVTVNCQKLPKSYATSRGFGNCK